MVPGAKSARSAAEQLTVQEFARESGWATGINQTIFRGSVFMEEVVFLHRGQRTLIVADLLQSFHEDSPPLERFLAWPDGRLGRSNGQSGGRARHGLGKDGNDLLVNPPVA